MNEEDKSWDRLPNESPKVYDAFMKYCEMGPDRSLSKLVNELSKSKSLLSRWSAKYSWFEGSSAYDIHFHKIKMKEREEAIIEHEKKMAETTWNFLDVVGKAIDNLKPEQIKPSEIPRYLKTLIPLERDSRDYLLALYEKQSQQRRLETERMTFRVEVVEPEEIRRRIEERKRNRLL